MTTPIDSEQAMKLALKLLTVRARGTHELQRALAARGADEQVCHGVLERLRKLGYVNDARFAADRAAVLLRRGRMGPRAIQERLEAVGLTEAQAQRALTLAQAELGLSPTDVARRLLTQRNLDLANLSAVARARAARLLLARGFEPNVVETLLGSTALDPAGQDD